MRHVILGSNTLIGSSIIKLLSRIGGEVIVCCDPNGFPPRNVSNPDLIIEQADVIDPYSLMEVLEEGDVVYHTQILEDENSDYDDSHLIHHEGIVNLLGVANQKQVDKIVCHIPQVIGWKIPSMATEDTVQEDKSPYQVGLTEMLQVIYKYWQGENFGWSKFDLDSLQKTVESPERNENQDDPDEDNAPKNDNNSKLPPTNAKNGPTDQTEVKSSCEAQSQGPTLTVPTGIKAPNLGGPSLGPKPDVQDVDTVDEKIEINDKNGDEDKIDNNEDLDKEDEDEDVEVQRKEEQEEIEQEEEVLNEVPLVVARMGRLFGPYDHTITEMFCRSIRLQRIKIKGKWNCPISWIHPLDAGRAMILAVDLEPDQYNFVGFTKTPREILAIMDGVNFSSIKTSSRPVFISRISFRFKRLFKKLGFSVRLDYFSEFGLTRRQSFDDAKVRGVINWNVSYEIEKTAKESLNWFVNHVLR